MSYQHTGEHNGTSVPTKSSVKSEATSTSTMTSTNTAVGYTEAFLSLFKRASIKPSVSSEASTVPSDALPPGVFDKACAEINAPSEPSLGKTWNGDVNYAELSDDQRDIASAILAFTQKLVMEPTPKAQGSGKKRRAQKALPLDPVENLSQSEIHRITSQLTDIISRIKGMSPIDQAIYTNILFVTMFRERAITSGSRSSIGKGHRSISYLIFRVLHTEMPMTTKACLPLFVHFGYWGDLNAICAHYIKDGNDHTVVNECVSLMLTSLDKSVRSLPGSESRGFLKQNGEVMTHSELRTLLDTTRTAVIGASDDELKAKYSGVHNDNCAKYLPSEKKRHDHLRPLIIAGMLWEGDVHRALSAATFSQATLNRLTTILRRLGNVVETRMSANDWTFDPKMIPASALNKHRKAFMNEIVGQSPALNETDGNRSDNPDRIALRHKLLVASAQGLVKGAGMDSVKFAQIFKEKTSVGSFTHAEKTVLHAQFMNIVDDIRVQLQKEYDESLAIWIEDGSNPETKPLNPFNIIATIDVSGSMSHANVMAPAIILGIIVTQLSNLGNTYLTFHENPRLITLDTRDGTTIVDWYFDVIKAPWGGSTNIDSAMKLLLKLFKNVRSTNKDFDGRVNHIIFTDGQFNPHFCQFDNSLYSYSDSDTDYSNQWNPFAKRMSEYFHENGFALPLTCFWNMACQSPGFPAHSKYTGLTLSEGLSHGLLVNVLGNKVVFKVDEHGNVVADTDPITSFLQGLARDDFTPVVDTVLATREGVFSDESTHPHVRSFLATYVKDSK